MGTSSFKCAPVRNGELLAEPVELQYELDYANGEVTVPEPEQYIRLALQALKQGAEQARRARISVSCIGICSQAQTFVGVDERGAAVTPAVVWLDNRAIEEVETLSQQVQDFGIRTGFPKPSPLMFMTKVLHDSLHTKRLASCSSVLLLNEFVLLRLTGSAYGDTTLQGMGGFFDISANKCNDDFTTLCGIKSSQLAPSYPAAGLARTLLKDYALDLDIPEVPVVSCGNDQCCAAIGAGARCLEDVVCNFGTAMVVYGVRVGQPTEIKRDQIAGIDPLSRGYFLLGLESDCGNRIDRAFQGQSTSSSIDEMIRDQGSAEVRALLKHLSDRFWRLLSELVASPRNVRFIASGGLSRSNAWLHYLEHAHDIHFERAVHEHASLVGIELVIERHWNTANGA